MALVKKKVKLCICDETPSRTTMLVVQTQRKNVARDNGGEEIHVQDDRGRPLHCIRSGQ